MILFGGAAGAVAGAAASAVMELFQAVTFGFGAAFGIAVWIYADNLLLWALRLAKAPTSYPLPVHAYALASHVVYGLALEAARLLVRPMLPP